LSTFLLQELLKQPAKNNRFDRHEAAAGSKYLQELGGKFYFDRLKIKLEEQIDMKRSGQPCTLKEFQIRQLQSYVFHNVYNKSLVVI
jgi:hypothetical protein